MERVRRTPFYEKHLSQQGKMVDFGGWELPVQYRPGIVEEHLRVREAAGLFDVSHMGEILVEGEDAEAWLQGMVTNDVRSMHDGQVLYSLLCYPNGGVVDDLLIYRYDPRRYFLVVNASNAQKDYEWFAGHASGNVRVTDRSADYAELALQGPKAQQILQRLTKFDLDTIPFFHFAEIPDLAGMAALVSRTGYTGEDGFEIFLPWTGGTDLWDVLLDAGKPEGLLPIGLGARDSLRFEACLPLYGHEISVHISPLEADLGRFVRLDKPFIGRDALAAMKAGGIPRTIIGLSMEDKGVPRAGYTVRTAGGTEIGTVTTGGFSPSLGTGIALALLDASHCDEEVFDIDIHGKERRAKRVKKPFVRKRYHK
jgi:aminomethyltransferase